MTPQEGWLDYAKWCREFMSAPAGEHAARLAERAAESLDLEEATGVFHCVCHMIPIKECAARAAQRRRR